MIITLFRRNRIGAALLVSVVFNSALLIVSFFTDTRGGRPTALSEVIELLGLPAGAVTSLLAGGEHGGGAQIFVMIAASIAFYMGVAWIVLRLLLRDPDVDARANR